MRPMTVRIAKAIACALLLLAVTGNVAFAGEPKPPQTQSVPADPGYELP